VIQFRELIPLVTGDCESPGEAWTLLAVSDAGLPLPVPQWEVDVPATVRPGSTSPTRWPWSPSSTTASSSTPHRKTEPRMYAVTILDDAREGMDPDIRPQDDLFGHVNGRWLDDRRDPRRPVELGAVRAARRRRRGAGPRDHRGLAERAAEGDTGLDETPSKIGDLYASFMDEDRIDASAPRRSAPLLDAVDGLRDVRDLAAFLGEFERLGGAGCSAPTSTPTTATPTATCQPHPGRPRAARRVLLPRREVRRDPREVRRLPRDGCSARRRRRPEAGAGRDRPGDRDPARRRATGSAPRPATSRRPTT
jgi:hypothetical protein